MSSLGKGRNPDLAIATLLFVLLSCVFLLTMSGAMFTIDFRISYLLTQALAERQSIYLPAIPDLLYQGRDGLWVAKYGIGLSLLAVPGYLLGKLAHELVLPSSSIDQITYAAASLTNVLVTAATGSALFALGRVLGFRRGVACALTVAWGVASPAWTYSLTFFGEPLVALCTVVGLLALVSYQRVAGARRLAFLTLSGFSLGYALITRVSSAIVLPFFLAYLVYALSLGPDGEPIRRAARRLGLPRPDVGSPTAGSPTAGSPIRLISALMSFAIPLIACGIGVLWYNYARHGSALDFGYAGEAFSGAPLEGIYGLLASPGKGLLVFSPIVALAVVGWPHFFRRHPAVALLCASVFLVTLVQSALWWAWWGGWCWGPRFLVPVLPFAFLPLCSLLERSRLARGAAWVLGGLGLAVAVLGSSIDVNAYLQESVVRGFQEPLVYLRPDLSPILGHARYLLTGQHLNSLWLRALGSERLIVRLAPVGGLLVLVTAAALLFAPGGLARESERRSADSRIESGEGGAV